MNILRTDADVSLLPLKAKPYKKSVGRSLYVYVMPGGAKYWRMSYRSEGKQSTLSLGIFPETNLTEAIRLRDEAKRLLKQGRDPNEEKHAARAEAKLRKARAAFQYSMSAGGELSITSGRNHVCLNRDQTLALRAFLIGSGD